MNDEERLKHPRPWERFTRKELDVLENLLKTPGGFQRQYILLQSLQEEIEHRKAMGAKVLGILNRLRIN